MKKILLSCPFPLTFRNFINTGLAGEMQEKLGVEVAIVSPYEQSEFVFGGGFRFVNLTVPSDGLDSGIPLLPEVSKLDAAFKSIHLTGFAIEYPDASLQNIELSSRRSASWYIAKFLTIVAPRKSWLRRNFRRWYGYYRPRKKSIQKAFTCVQPEFVLVASPGHYWLDHLVIDEAKRRKIPVFCIILSWDNLYSRGPLCRRPDYMMVWSEEMRKQAIEIHAFNKNLISVVGALQFRYYEGIPAVEHIQKVKNHLQLDSEDEYIAYVCGARTAEYDVEDILTMKDVIEQSCYRNCKLIVRPHPQGDKKAYDILDSYGIIVDRGLDITKGTADAFDKDSIQYMAAFLAGARFVVSSWGTTALLEACIFQRPSVQLRWMDAIPHANPEEVQKVRNFQRYLHMKPFDREGARLYCDAPEQLLSIFAELESNQKIFAERRRSTVEKLVATPLPQVIDRIISVLAEKSNIINSESH
jgi:hypothetical protein